ncbi:OmpA family protein [Roseicyclus sp. F158]|uniref:OmpA family protein n=1 Tax=Tropicimonas omnivorans TaxID=3075590 RepID=A0ABU3DEK4_9RHOB|nr:OmpA family protein [Roseicyclus sp. F158]MDT0682149.1 OmpA family protein [Roseicyclus sp. F158]
MATSATAQEKYIPTIWVDPDGCEHWVMDDGAEGYMSSHLDSEGLPICRMGAICGVMNSDTLFATDSATVRPGARQSLVSFFRSADARAFAITGHTDSRASDEYNMNLSQRRASAVAQVAQQAGVPVLSVRGYGERQPRASNATAAGMAQNRRVEVQCIK